VEFHRNERENVAINNLFKNMMMSFVLDISGKHLLEMNFRPKESHHGQYCKFGTLAEL